MELSNHRTKDGGRQWPREVGTIVRTKAKEKAITGHSHPNQMSIKMRYELLISFSLLQNSQVLVVLKMSLSRSQK
jgi:hypothetical protein